MEGIKRFNLKIFGRYIGKGKGLITPITDNSKLRWLDVKYGSIATFLIWRYYHDNMVVLILSTDTHGSMHRDISTLLILPFSGGIQDLNIFRGNLFNFRLIWRMTRLPRITGTVRPWWLRSPKSILTQESALSMPFRRYSGSCLATF